MIFWKQFVNLGSIPSSNWKCALGGVQSGRCRKMDGANELLTTTEEWIIFRLGVYCCGKGNGEGLFSYPLPLPSMGGSRRAHVTDYWCLTRKFHIGWWRTQAEIHVPRPSRTKGITGRKEALSMNHLLWTCYTEGRNWLTLPHATKIWGAICSSYRCYPNQSTILNPTAAAQIQLVVARGANKVAWVILTFLKDKQKTRFLCEASQFLNIYTFKFQKPLYRSVLWRTTLASLPSDSASRPPALLRTIL